MSKSVIAWRLSIWVFGVLVTNLPSGRCGDNSVSRLSGRIDHIGYPRSNGLLRLSRCDAGLTEVCCAERYDYAVSLGICERVVFLDDFRFSIKHGASPEIRGREPAPRHTYEQFLKVQGRLSSGRLRWSGDTECRLNRPYRFVCTVCRM